MDKSLVKKSKHLSKVLRHDPGSVGLKLDAAGWVNVGELLTAMKLSRDDLEQVVAENDKKRFEFNADRTCIRASQGHSVDVDLGYEEQTPPEFLWHGTSLDVLPAIREKGLLKMDRHHVHLSADEATANIVARRRPRSVLVKVASGEMARAGTKFYRSTNGVWLTDHVPARYLRFGQETGS